MMRAKAAISLLLVLCICCISVLSISEVKPVKWNDATDHNRWTQAMIFGNESYTYAKPKDIRLRVKQLLDALLLCIDQFNGSYSDKLSKLCFIQGVPSDLSAINFTAGNSKEETSHRAYTHRGWNHVYANFQIEKSHPEIRKQILISVVSHVFGFKNTESNQQVNKVCDAMCCLLYNTHIIEDRYHSKSYYGAASTLLLADTSPQTESVTHDLLECLPSLFPNEKKTGDNNYNGLINGIRKIEKKILSAIKSVRKKYGGDDRDSFLMIDRKYTVKQKNLLKKYIPRLLQKQKWFTDAFDPKYNSN